MKGRTLVRPIFGFWGKRSDSKPGESPPPKAGYGESHFDDYAGTIPEPTLEVISSASSGTVEVRTSRQGRITVINRGPAGAGFRTCFDCGYSEPVLGAKTKEKPPPHPRPNRPDTTCKGSLRFTQLGHEYLTDVVDIRLLPTTGLTTDNADSVLAALLAATPAIGITGSDVDGSVFVHNNAAPPAIARFDAVPGGAGHAARLAEELPALLRAAHERAATGECGEETSCYSCLRSYSNQHVHEQLRRGDAAAVLGAVVGVGPSSTS